MQFNPEGLTNAEVVEDMAQMDQAITMQGSVYDSPRKQTGGSAGESTSPEHGKQVARFYDDESSNLHII